MLPTFVAERKAKFQLNVTKNNVIVFPSKFTDLLKFIHVPLVKNRWSGADTDANLINMETLFLSG